MRILLVEDEVGIRQLVQLNLEMEGYEVITATDGKIALQLLENQHFDLILLDLMLPEVSGLQVAEQFRLRDFETPILMLTARDSATDRVLGLKKGADDYLVKPFVIEELLLRIQKLIKRANRHQEQEQEKAVFGENEVNFVTFEARTPNGVFHLTKKEALLLKLLIERKNEVVSRQQILQSVWGYDVYPSTRTIDNFILAFRKYFEKDPKNPHYFHSIRGVGYRFTE